MRIYYHVVFAEVYNRKRSGVGYVDVPLVSGEQWIISKYKDLEGLNIDDFAKGRLLRRMKSKASIKGNELVRVVRILSTKDVTGR